eukprot:2669255-Amphidinium_carterae.1
MEVLLGHVCPSGAASGWALLIVRRACRGMLAQAGLGMCCRLRAPPRPSGVGGGHVGPAVG